MEMLEARAEISNLECEMIAAGYECRAPDEEVGALDALIFERRPCQRCGGSVSFHPFFKEEGGRSYRPFVVCRECGYVEEV